MTESGLLRETFLFGMVKMTRPENYLGWASNSTLCSLLYNPTDCFQERRNLVWWESDAMSSLNYLQRLFIYCWSVIALKQRRDKPLKLEPLSVFRHFLHHHRENVTEIVFCDGNFLVCLDCDNRHDCDNCDITSDITPVNVPGPGNANLLVSAKFHPRQFYLVLGLSLHNIDHALIIWRPSLHSRQKSWWRSAW